MPATPPARSPATPAALGWAGPRQAGDPDAAAYVAAVRAAGAAVSAAQADAIDAFVRREKSAGRWTSHRRIYLPVWADAGANKIDMAACDASATWAADVSHGRGWVQADGDSGGMDLAATLPGLGLGTTTSACLWGICLEAPAGTAHDWIIGARDSESSILELCHFSDSTMRFFAFDKAAGGGDIPIAITPRRAQAGAIVASRHPAGWDVAMATASGSAIVATRPAAAGCGAVPSGNLWALRSHGTGMFSDGKFGGWGVSAGLGAGHALAFAASLKALWEEVSGMAFGSLRDIMGIAGYDEGDPDNGWVLVTADTHASCDDPPPRHDPSLVRALRSLGGFRPHAAITCGDLLACYNMSMGSWTPDVAKGDAEAAGCAAEASIYTAGGTPWYVVPGNHDSTPFEKPPGKYLYEAMHGAVENDMCLFSGSISGTTLSVASVRKGALRAGHVLCGDGVAAGTRITAAGGDPGTWVVDKSQACPATEIGTLVHEVFDVGGVRFMASPPNHDGSWTDGQLVLVAETLASLAPGQELVFVTHYPGYSAASEWHAVRALRDLMPDGDTRTVWQLCGHNHSFADTANAINGATLRRWQIAAGRSFHTAAPAAAAALWCRNGKVHARFACDCAAGSWSRVPGHTAATAPLRGILDGVAGRNVLSHWIEGFHERTLGAEEAGKPCIHNAMAWNTWRPAGTWLAYCYDFIASFPLPPTAATGFFIVCNIAPTTLEVSADNVTFAGVHPIPALADQTLVFGIPAPAAGQTRLYIRFKHASGPAMSAWGFLE